jgi:hypothetical protein
MQRAQRSRTRGSPLARKGLLQGVPPQVAWG